jgi:uncharacterized protein YbcC (UPF0753/DUF2309 family)
MDDLRADSLEIRGARLKGAARNAADVVMAMWPLTSFIAANPARIMERQPFDRAVTEVQQRLGGRGLLPPAVYRGLAAKGFVDHARLREAFERRAGGSGEDTLTVADAVVPVAEARWLAHFEIAFSGVGDPALAAAADAAARRVPTDARVDRDRRDEGGPLARTVDTIAARWVAAYTDTGQASWALPRREEGLFAAWRALVAHDPTLSADARARLERLLGGAEESRAERLLVRALDELGVEEAAWQPTLEWHLLRLPGWASFLKWRAELATPGTPDAELVTQYLALRLLYTAALAGELESGSGEPPPAESAAALEARVARHAAALARIAEPYGITPARLRGLPAGELTALVRAFDALDGDAQSLIWLEAQEESYRRDLLGGIARHLHLGTDGVDRPDSPARPAAQLVFCIDVRSEPLRRNLEKLGAYETFGFAGFFGVPIAYRGFDEAVTLDVCPALLRPRYRVSEAPSPCCAAEAEAHRDGRRLLWQLRKLASRLKGSAAACYGFVEAAGLGFLVPFVAKTFAPGAYDGLKARLGARLAPPVELTPELEPGAAHPDAHGLTYGLSAEEKAFFGEAALSVMGLTRNFARLVVMVGHGSRTENNPYGPALDCGACGGNTGGPSARVLATLLNEAEVRRKLAERGIAIPDDTWFMAAEHNTTTDEVVLFNAGEAPAAHGPDVAALRHDLATARDLNCAERRVKLTLADDGAPSATAHALARATDWAQVRPEWGLARNAAFVVGPRWLTAPLNLESRTFLHSYDWRGDDGGKALEIILTAPMVVAEWINTQYYFSTVDNARFGSGTKVIHNVTGRLGVVQGNAGDLQIGLPEQSVMTAEGELYHEPLRLMTVVLAPPERVTAIVEQNAVLRQLFDHDWVALVVLDPATGRFRRYAPGGRWLEAGPATAAPTSEPTVATTPNLREPAL